MIAPVSPSQYMIEDPAPTKSSPLMLTHMAYSGCVSKRSKRLHSPVTGSHTRTCQGSMPAQILLRMSTGMCMKRSAHRHQHAHSFANPHTDTQTPRVYIHASDVGAHCVHIVIL